MLCFVSCEYCLARQQPAELSCFPQKGKLQISIPAKAKSDNGGKEMFGRGATVLPDDQDLS